MCDDITEAENAEFLARRKLSRREFGVGAGAVVAATVAAGCGPSGPATSAPEPDDAVPPPTPTSEPATAEAPPLVSRRVTITTPDGEAEGLFVAPGSGKHPAVLMWPDVAGMRPAFEGMATRLAGEGYAVLVVNPYYRSSKLPIFQAFAEWRTDEGKAKVRPMIEALSPEGVAKDAGAFIAWLDQQPEVDTARKVGTAGYCMSGSFAFVTAATVPGRVGVFASFHGGGLVTDGPESPHALLPGVQAAALVCVAQNDDERDAEAKSTLRSAAEAAGVTAEIEVYAANHGWTVTDSPVYDEPEAERAWSRLLATLDEHL